MSKTVSFSLKRDLVYEAVKTETYITGKTEIANDGSTNAKVYNEQAGDDTFHERKMARSFRAAIGSLESNLIEFIDPTNGSITDSVSQDQQTITINMVVSDRFNSSLANTLANLSQDYIINQMIALWWVALKPDLAAQYKAFATESWLSVRKCLTKMAPTISQSQYDDIQGTVTTA